MKELSFETLLGRQREACLGEGPPSAEVRIDRIDRCIDLLVAHQGDFTDAISSDFGCRPVAVSLGIDVSASIARLRQSRDRLRHWMRTERRPTTPRIVAWIGGSARIEPQPLGVVGLISPWNCPLNLIFAPLASILAAGNRCMVKPSETTPATSALLARLVARSFDESELTVCLGGPAEGEAFSRLGFDHLLFTGSAAVGRRVMQAAAEHLVPVTLELGGKCPVILGRSADIAMAASRVMAGKTINAGQICIAPDYVLLPADRRDEFVTRATAAVARMYPTLAGNPDYTSIIDDRNMIRLRALLADATGRGGRALVINPAGEELDEAARKMAPTLILDPAESMLIMQEEIFGPLLPLVTYRTIDEAISFVNGQPRPLALYYFGSDRDEERRVLARTTSGGVTVNDVLMHAGMSRLPFGGVGASGMGAYGAEEGFRRFSHFKPVFREPTWTFFERALARHRPPYGAPHPGNGKASA
ncbi:MAG: hypothetical protein RLZZ326_1375 [Planctomycetota bacterium]|jgi:coniferyl-aldehyde dehydrogenase